jgi:hypothetical protein
MRVFYRSAPVFVALSVALAGCSDADSPSAKGGTTVRPAADSGSTVAGSVTPSASSEVCLTVEGMT